VRSGHCDGRVERTAGGSKKVACEESKCAVAGAVASVIVVAVAVAVVIGNGGGGDCDTEVLKKKEGTMRRLRMEGMDGYGIETRLT
jgi:hypothetical protein